MTEFQVPVDDAMARLAVIEDYDCGNGPEPCVHTFAASGFGLLGAHWSVGDVREFFERCGVDEAGPTAAGMKHGLVATEKKGDGRDRTIFFETRDES